MESRQERIPRFLRELGEDSEDFFVFYDRIQDELDDEMVNRLKENLDGLLVFAGLIAGVNSAFLALTLILMSPDPADDIRSLLYQLVQGLKDPPTLPSTIFTPSLRALAINILFALSLALIFVASFFAILGKQWVAIYRNKTHAGVDKQRWKQLRRSLSAERWGLAPALETALPVTIQVALIIFCIGLVLFLGTMSQSLADAILVPLGATALVYMLTVGLSVWDSSCPFRTPLSGLFRSIPRVVSPIFRLFRSIPRVVSTIPCRLQVFVTLRRLHKWMKSQRASSIQEANQEEDDERAGGINSLYDEEKGNAGINIVVEAGGDRTSRSGREQWRSLVRMIAVQRRGAIMHPNPGLGGSLPGLPLGRKSAEEQVLLVESIMRVIRFSQVPEALYLAALQLRSVTNSKLLESVCRDEGTTCGLRRSFFEALEDLDKTPPSAKTHSHQLRKTLGLGTAFFHVAISAGSFDDFIRIIGMRKPLLPQSFSEMSLPVAWMAGNACRHAQSHLHSFMNLQLCRLGPQPEALTSTTLAVTALWYAVNGIPHSQDIVYGDRFREALAGSEVSWAGLGLLASVSNNTCQFHDVRKRTPYGMQELNWCRESFLRVRAAYHSSGLTKGLADAIHDSLSSGKNLETNAILFKFTWKLFTRDDYGEHFHTKLGEYALSAGQHLICAIEKSIRIRSSKGYKKWSSAREMCFKAMMEHVGPRGGEIKILKAVAWRQRLVLMTATAYMKYIMDFRGHSDKEEDAHAKDFMEQIREAQPQGLGPRLAMGKEYADAKREFEATFSRFSLHDIAGMVVSGDRIHAILSYWYQQKEEDLSDVRELMSLAFGFESEKPGRV